MFDYTGYVVICFHFSIFEPLETTGDTFDIDLDTL